MGQESCPHPYAEGQDYKVQIQEVVTGNTAGGCMKEEEEPLEQEAVSANTDVTGNKVHVIFLF